MTERIRVLIADDHSLLTTGLKMIISEWEEFLVVGIASDGQQAVALCESLRPDLVVMDMQMPKLSGSAAVRNIKGKCPGIRILALTTFDDDETVAGAIQSGCDGFLLKAIDPDVLRSALMSVARGINVFDEKAMKHYRAGGKKRPELEFSSREMEILELLCSGMTNAEIAERLKLRPGTIKNLISLLLSKTGCISRAKLARYARENKIIK